MAIFNLRNLFIIFTIKSILVAMVIIAVAIVEIFKDQEEMDGKRERKKQPKDDFYITHMFLALSIMVISNFIIILHAVYITQHVLRGLRYNWYLSWNYFHYLICEIISVCCIISSHDYLEYPTLLHILTAALAVLLFFFNYWAMEIFSELESKIKEQEDLKNKRQLSAFFDRQPCVRIPLSISPDAGPSAARKAPPRNPPK